MLNIEAMSNIEDIETEEDVVFNHDINAGHHRKHRIANVKFRGKDRAPARRYYENLSKRFCKRMSHKYSRRKLELENGNYLIGNPYYLS